MASSPASTIVSAEQRGLLERLVGARGTPQSVALRPRIVLLAAQGGTNSAIARRLSVSRPTVIMWRASICTSPPPAAPG
jgi:DNA-binding NarL/FixJ family response regulator